MQFLEFVFTSKSFHVLFHYHNRFVPIESLKMQYIKVISAKRLVVGSHTQQFILLTAVKYSFPRCRNRSAECPQHKKIL